MSIGNRQIIVFVVVAVILLPVEIEMAKTWWKNVKDAWKKEVK